MSPREGPVSASDRPEVAAAIADVRRAWNARLLMACLTMTAILAFFLIDRWTDPRLPESLGSILFCYVALAVLFFLVVRWTIARQTADIRAKAARRAP